ncbi:MAG: mechanosensitive ion channel family protein [Pseudomonadota bacterium]
MNADDLTELSDLYHKAAEAGQINAWATATLIALAAITLLRFAIKTWHWKDWTRRIFWVAYLFLLPLSLIAAVHIIGVTFDISEHVWLQRSSDALLAILLAILIVEGLDLFLWKGYAQKKFGHPTPNILIGVSAFLVYFATAYVIAAVIFDIPVTGALVSSGIVLGVIGLSLQGTISDIFSGVFISLERPFRIGDWIVTEDDRLGKVIEIDWRATRLLSFNNTVFVVPNSKMANSIIENRAEPDALYGHYFYVSMSPEAPVGLVRRVLLEAVLSSPYVQSDPPPSVRLAKANQRPYQYLVYVYFENYEASWRGNGDVQIRVHEYLKRAGLNVSGESRDLRYSKTTALPDDEPPIQQLLADIDLFQGLSEDELEILSRGVRTNRFRPGDMIMNEGDEGDSLLVITAGLVLVTRNNPMGKQVSVTRLGIGQCVGEMSLLTGRPRSATVEAVTDSEIVEIPKDAVNGLLEERPDLVDELARIMTERRAAEELVTDRDLGQVNAMTLQDIADRFGRRIRRFFHL